MRADGESAWVLSGVGITDPNTTEILKKEPTDACLFFLTHPHKANISSHASPVSIGASSQYSAITKMAQQSKSSAVKLAHTV